MPITNALELPTSLQEYAQDALKPGQYLHWYIKDNNEITYGDVNSIGGGPRAHHSLPTGLFYYKGRSGQLYTWHHKKVGNVTPHLTQDFDQIYSE